MELSTDTPPALIYLVWLCRGFVNSHGLRHLSSQGLSCSPWTATPRDGAGIRMRRIGSLMGG